MIETITYTTIATAIVLFAYAMCGTTITTINKNMKTVKLLTCADEWSYHANFDSEQDALEYIELHGYDTRRCKIEYPNAVIIRVDKLLSQNRENSHGAKRS
jgi:hypothetical protein